MIELGERPVWQEIAACHGKTDLFFPNTYAGRSAKAVYGDLQKARAICENCPVIADCLKYSLELPHPWHGVYAGLSPRQRMKLKGKTPT